MCIRDRYGNTVGCLEKFPDDSFFWVKGKKLCSKTANGCAARQDRKSHISEDNPTGIRHNFASTAEGRRTELYRTLGTLVSRARGRSKSENMDFDLTKEWAIKRCEDYKFCVLGSIARMISLQTDIKHVAWKNSERFFQQRLEELIQYSCTLPNLSLIHI